MLISSDGWVLCVKLASKGKKHHSLIHEIWENKILFKRLFICIASLKHLNCKATCNIISREENEEQGHILYMEPMERKLFFCGWKFWKLAWFFFLVLSACATVIQENWCNLFISTRGQQSTANTVTSSTSVETRCCPSVSPTRLSTRATKPQGVKRTTLLSLFSR